MRCFLYSRVFLLIACCICLPAFSSGAAVKDSKKTRKDIEARLLHAETARKKWLEHLENARTVNETVRAKDELDKIQIEIEELKAGREVDVVDDNTKFKSVKKRKRWYGPLGAVLHMTQYILEKLYIMESD